jgi:hypothetical protein
LVSAHRHRSGLPHRVRQWINGLVSGTADDDTFRAYYRANSPRAFRRLAAAAGMNPVSIEYVSHHPVYCLFSFTVYRIAVRIERIVRRYVILARLRHILLATFEVPVDDRDVTTPR